VIYEYEVPGGALNLKYINYPDHDRQGDLPLKEISPWQNRQSNPDLIISSQKLWPLDHEARLLSSCHIVKQQLHILR
jgi:hypothetical protein